MHPVRLLPALVLAVASSIAAAAPITLRVLAQESIPPKWLREGNVMAGVCPDIMAAIERLEPRLRFARDIGARSIPMLEQGLANGSIDGACALLDTERRREIALIVGPPLYAVRHRLAARRDDGAVIASMADLVRLKPLINTQRSAAYADQLRSHGLQVDDSSGDNVVNLRKVIAGHGRFFYINELTLTWLMEQAQFKGKVRMLDWVVKEEPIYFYVSKKSPAGAAPLLGRALRALKENGELARIYARWARMR